jgi:hypothetical protein
VRARLVVEGIDAGSGDARGTLDVTVVEVEYGDATRKVLGLSPLSRIVSDPSGGPGPAVRVFMDTREMED